MGPIWHFSSKSGYEWFVNPSFSYENVPQTFFLSDQAEVPAGEYRFAGLKMQFSTPSRRALAATMNLDAGSFYDGRRFSLGLNPKWSALSDLELEGFYEFDQVTFPSRGQEFIAHIARLRALYMLSTKFSASAFIQYNSASQALIGNVRFRYNPREGIDLYLVYNEALNTSRSRQVPVLPPSASRAVMIKYSHTFTL